MKVWLRGNLPAGYVPAGAFVNAYLGIGNNEATVQALEQGYKEKSTIVHFVKTSIRSAAIPGFNSWLSGLG